MNHTSRVVIVQRRLILCEELDSEDGMQPGMQRKDKVGP
jgi:hypothetical protein